MKLKHLFIAAAAAIFALTGCSKDNSGDGFSVNPESIEINSEGGTETITVSYSGEWQVSASESWITVSPTSGKGNGTVSAAIAKSTETTNRSAVIKFTYGNAVKEVSVTQGGGAYLSVKTTYTNPVPATANEIEFVVEANVAYTVSVDEAAKSWITVNSTKGLKTDNVKVSIAANTGAVRSGVISFATTEVEGMDPTTFTIEQSAASSDPTKIKTADDFFAMLARPQSATCDTTYTIMNDIDFTGYTVTYDNSFKGNFYANIDGNGKKFTNYTATADMIQKINGTVKNLTIESGSFTLEPDHSCGIFCEQVEAGGVAENLVSKVAITGDVSTTTTFHQGTLCGICRGTMKGCKNYGNVTINLTQGKSSAHYRFGGIAGSTTPSDATGHVFLENCENQGNIEIKCVNAIATVYLAGITAVADSKTCDFSINGCTNTGKLSVTNPDGFTGTVYLGGLVGQRNEGEIKNCTNSGCVDASALNKDKVYVGGIVAFQKAGYSDTAFQNCTINADVKASFLDATSTTANPLANAGMIIGKVGDAGVTFGGVGNEAIKVGGALYNGDTKIAVTSANLSDLVIGSACTYAPTFSIKLAQ